MDKPISSSTTMSTLLGQGVTSRQDPCLYFTDMKIEDQDGVGSFFKATFSVGAELRALLSTRFP